MKKLLVAAVVVLGLAFVPVANASAATANGRIAYEAPITNGTAIYSANPDGSDAQALTDPGSIATRPKFSPDGTKIAFLYHTTGSSSGSYGDIYIMNSDGSGKDQLVAIANEDWIEGVNWSPDGTKLIYAIGTEVAPGDFDNFIRTVNVSNKQVTTLINFDSTSNVWLLNPEYSPVDSDKILYQRPTGIYTMNGSGAGSQLIINSSPLAHGEAAFSPDGTKIAVTTPRTFTVNGTPVTYTNIDILNLDGSVYKQITNEQKVNIAPRFSPDGTKILYIANESGQNQVVIRDIADTAKTRRVTNDSQAHNKADWGSRSVSSSTLGNDGRVTNTVSSNQSTASYFVDKDEILVVSGQLGQVTVSADSVLKGTGTVGTLTVSTSGTLAPGNSPGCLSAGNTTLNGNFDVELGGTTACTEYDQLTVTGTVDISGSTLNLSRYNDFRPVVGNTFTIISNDGSDTITGTFSGLAQDATVTVNGYAFQVSYTGGDGNDVELTVTSVASGAPTGDEQSVAAPGTPNTGFALFTANPLLILSLATVSAGSLFILSRKYSAFVR